MDLLRRLRMLFRGNRFQNDLDEEIRLHVEMRVQANVNAGMNTVNARREAYLQFGNPTLLKEKSFMTWGWSWLESFVQDVSYGLRSMLRSPALTLVALLSLALGIGANTAIFSFLDAVMLRSLPVQQPEQLVLLGTGAWSGSTDGWAVTELYSYPMFQAMRQQNKVFTDVASIMSHTDAGHGTVDHRGETEKIQSQLVSGNYFSMLGVPAFIGRTLNDADDSSEGDHPVAVISYNWWQHNFNGDPEILKHTVTIGTTVFNIVGVAVPEFFGTKVGEAPDVWIPLSMSKQVPPQWDAFKSKKDQTNYILARLKPGVTVQQAESNVNLIYNQTLRSFKGESLSAKEEAGLKAAHIPLTPIANGLSSLRGQFSLPLQILMGVTALVLLIACANIANLLLARSTARVREFAVRQALGAKRSRLVRMLLTESLLLALLGGGAGVVLASLADRLLLRMLSGGADTVPLDVSLNPRLLAFTFAVTVATAVLFGVIPAFRATRLELTDALKDGRGDASSGAKSPLGKVLVVTQVALSLVLMVGATLFVRTLINLSHVDTGFMTEHVLRMDLDSSVMHMKSDDPRMVAFFKEIEDRVNATPGVKSASFASFLFRQGSWNGTVRVAGMQTDDNVSARHNVIGNRYFETMGIPLLAGRVFNEHDTKTSQNVGILSESMAKDLFPAGSSPIGHHYATGGNDIEVVGVVKDVKFGSLQEKKEYIDYIPNPQHPWGYGTLAVRYTGDYESAARAVQNAVHSVNKTLPIDRVMTLDAQIQRSITNQRLIAQLSAFFGVLAVFLSCIGIYGLMSYVVSRRTNEIGIRMALGAGRSNVRWLVMREIVLLVTAGVAIGVPATWAGGRIIQKMLFGVQGTDGASLFASVAALLLVGLFAGYLPARRASRVDPMVALRYE
jgi:predicted permease